MDYINIILGVSIIILIVCLIVLIICNCRSESYNPWNNNFKNSSIMPFIKNKNQGKKFKRPDCQTHPNCFGCPGFVKSNISYNLKWNKIEKPTGTIALLFLCNGTKPSFSNLWNKWSNNHFPIFIHNGTMKNGKTVEKVNTSYDNIVPGMISLLKEASKLNNLKGCIFLTESCIPIKSSAAVYKKLQYSPSILFYVNENLDKAQYTSYLTKEAIDAILKEYEKTKTANGYKSSMPNGGNDELLIPQLLKKFPNIPTEHGSVTFSCTTMNCINKNNGWVEKGFELEKGETSYPYYKSITKEFMDKLLDHESLFSRKYSKNCTMDGNSLENYLLQILSS